MSRSRLPKLPEHLVDEIHGGRCVAFVGAGFSAAAHLPDWRALLTDIAADPGLEVAVREHVQRMVSRPDAGAHEFDQAAQLVEDQIGRADFLAALRERLQPRALGDGMEARLRWLRGIPFRAVVTTNFDPILEGRVPSPAVYRDLLRPSSYRWWEEAFWTDTPRGAAVLKIHGDVRQADHDAAIVLTRQDYRRRLYHDPGYMTFLRGLLSTNTVLFLGFSFSDAYLNELRSQVLALFDYGHAGDDSTPLAYAVLNDVPDLTALHLERHEGIRVLGFETGRPDGARDFEGFDRYLEALWRATAVDPRFGKLLSGRRVLWVDSHPDNNEAGFRFLARAAEAHHQTKSRLRTALDADAALALMAAEGFGDHDLVVTHWGVDAEHATGQSTAERLLRGMRHADLTVPTVLFASPYDAARRKRVVLGLGAQAYCFTWSDLFRAIEHVCSDPRPGRTGRRSPGAAPDRRPNP
mgnify:CR=1 FL=1